MSYSLYAVKIGTSAILQVAEQSVDPGITEMLVSADGVIYNEHASIVSVRPIVRFSTTQISAALDICGVTGLVIDEAGSSNGVTLFFAQRDTGTGYTAGATHMAVGVALGLMYPTNLRASHEATDPASVEFALAAIGVSAVLAPLSIDKNQALVDLSPVISEVYTAGPWYVNGTVVADIQEFNLDFGITVASPSGSGNVWPTDAYFNEINPTMTCGCLDLPVLDDTLGVGALGVARTGITRAFLKKKAQGAANVADVTAEHIKFELAEGRINPGTFQGSHRGDAMTGLQVTSTWNGTLAPLAYTKEVAIAGT